MTLPDCILNINQDLERISQWANDNCLKINPLKSKCIFISRDKIISNDLEIRINNASIINVHTASNLGILFNQKLTWSNHIQNNISKTYGMLRNLWATQSTTPFNIRMLLAKSYLVPVLLYGCELFANCSSLDKQRLHVAYNSIARYVFKKRRHDRISSFSYQIFNMSFENLLKFKCLLLFYKIINTGEPNYLYERLQFARSNRGKKVIQIRFKSSRSEQQFLIYSIRLWNNLPSSTQIISNAAQFKKELKLLLA